MILLDLDLEQTMIWFIIKKINIPLCLIPSSSVIKNKNIDDFNSRLQKCFYESENF